MLMLDNTCYLFIFIYGSIIVNKEDCVCSILIEQLFYIIT